MTYILTFISGFIVGYLTSSLFGKNKALEPKVEQRKKRRVDTYFEAKNAKRSYITKKMRKARYMHEYYLKNRDRLLAQHREWHERNKNKLQTQITNKLPLNLG